MLLLSTALATELQPGDLVFHRSPSRQSEAIARATGSELTHVGVVLENGGRLMVLEAVQPVGWAEVDAWTARAKDHTILVKRVTDPPADMVARIQAVAVSFVGRSYDSAFSWSDERMYCSELVYKAFDRGVGLQIGALRELGDFNLADGVVKKLLTERYGAEIPLHEPVIAPSDMAADPRLVTVP